MRETIKTIIYPTITAVVLIAIWIVSIDIFHVPNYLIPAPGDVLKALRVGYIEGRYWPHFFFTFKSAALGYLLGCSLALIIGALVAESKTFERFVFPYIIALQSTPKIAIAPLILVWFGFGIESKIIMVALMSFFPMFINTMVGIRQTNQSVLHLMHVFSASRIHIFFNVKLPSAAGHIFAGLQISVVLGLIGAVVSEFVSSTRGLGYMIQAASVNMDVATMFACLFSLVAIGLSGTQLIRVLQQRLIFWNTAGNTLVDA